MWKVTIAHEDRAVHAAICLALENVRIDEKPLTVISAFCESDAKELIATHPDTALMVIAGKMGGNNEAEAGLVPWIREQLNNPWVRMIVLDQCAEKPIETDRMLQFDIEEFIPEKELIQARLRDRAIAAVKAYGNPPEMRKSPTGTGGILIVESNPNDRENLKKILSTGGYKVKAVETGGAGIDACRKRIPDLMILNVQMPDLEGIAVCRTLKSDEKTREIPVIFVMDATQLHRKEEGFAVGGADVMVKPLSAAEAIARVKLHLENQMLKQQLERQNQNLQQEIESRQNSQAQLRLLERAISESTNGIAIADARLPDHPVVYVNAGFERITGYSASEAIGKNCRFLQGSDRHQQARFAIRKALAKGEPCKVLLRNYRKNGTMFWNELSISPVKNDGGEITHYIGVQFDVSERQSAEAARREQEQFLRSIYDGVELCIFAIDVGETGEFRFGGINPAHERLTGFSDQAIRGKTPEEVLPAEVAKRIIQRYQICVEKGTAICYEECLPLHGEPTWWLTTLTPLRDDNGKIYRIVGTGSHISDRKRAEEQLREAAYAAEAANRAKSAFLTNMSHELRTPLNAILGFAQVLDSSPNLTAQERDYLKIIQRSGENFLGLINDILEFSKMEAGRTTIREEEFNLLQLLRDIKEMFRLKAEQKQLNLDFILASNLPRYIRCDRFKLRQILMHLLGNAIKFTRQGWVILRGTYLRDNYSKTTSRLHFSISDTGIGIAPSDLETLFDPFVQTRSGKKFQEGTGLGLAISRQYVELLGGEIDVTSKLGVGSTFYFEVQVTPIESHCVAQVSAARTRDRHTITRESPQTEYRILIVDDSPDNQKHLAQLLSPLGFQLREAGNGEEAIALWKAFHPHLILMDMNMPILDGYEATRQIRAEAQGIPPNASPPPPPAIVGMSASTLSEEKSAAFAVGCDDLIAPPIQLSTLLNKIAQHLYIPYLDAENINPSPALKPPSDRAIIHSFLSMPVEWKSALEQATLGLDYSELLDLLARIPPEHASLAAQLQTAIDNFDYEGILQLIEQARKLG